MAIVRYSLDPNRKPTEKELEELRRAAEMPITYDEDSPFLTEEELARFRRVSEIRQAERKKQTVTLRLSPAALRKARSLGKGYTAVLSRIVESALNDAETIKRYL